MNIAITDVADRRLDDYRHLTDVALRRRLEPANGLFIAEGEVVVRRAVQAGYVPRSLLLLDRYCQLASLAGGAPVFLGFMLWSFHSRILPNWIAVSILPMFCLMVAYWSEKMQRWSPARRGEVGVQASACAPDTLKR